MSAMLVAEPAAIETLSFEAALRELESIVSRLEQGEVDLEDSIALYERGQALKAHCEKKLKAAEGRLEITALSVHAYAYVHDKYVLLPHGASVGDRYGPILVGLPNTSLESLKQGRVAIPGRRTTASAPRPRLGNRRC